MKARRTSENSLKKVVTEANLAALSNINSGQHSSVWGRLVTISLNLHTASNTRDGLLTREIGNVLREKRSK